MAVSRESFGFLGLFERQIFCFSACRCPSRTRQSGPSVQLQPVRSPAPSVFSNMSICTRQCSSKKKKKNFEGNCQKVLKGSRRKTSATLQNDTALIFHLLDT